MNPRYSIGIDLGTTNCALAYVDLGGADSVSQTLPLRQRESERIEVERTSLPSFLYWNDDGKWELGLFAREKGRELPDRVVHSAKSWLCHHSVSPEAKTLPWRSKVVPDADKLSPIEASARLLEVLKESWDKRFGQEAPFRDQLVTVTVPASFDAAAQAATLEAAKLAAYPDSVRLLEEPQAAFYRWLESAGGSADELKEGERILVVDIGGGTSDFSLFRVGTKEAGRPSIERLSVSEHLLLGGDNIDLALSHALESELAPDGEELSVDQWGFLLSRARELKERCLSEAVVEDQSISVSLPSKGSTLFAGTLATEVSSLQARELIVEGFFPECPKSARAERSGEGLLEIGLPYAADCAVTRHLAEFLEDGFCVDRVLFNGGSLSPALVQERLLDQFAAWQEGAAPQVLDNAETDLAVARGAACYGATLHRGRRQINAGAARAIFLELGSGADAKRVCVLPKGAQPGDRFELEIAGLLLAVNQRSRFHAFQGADSMTHAAGEWCNQKLDAMRALPSLDARVELEGRETVPVRLLSGVNELGILTVKCQSTDASVEGEWPLDFNLRGDSAITVVASSEGLEVPRVKADRARAALRTGLASKGQGLKASRIVREMEKILGKPKHEWSLELCRDLAGTPLELSDLISRNAETAESWLQLTGYLMRPGFGTIGDEARLRQLSDCLAALVSLPAKVEVQLLILLRRVAAGYSATTQVDLFEQQFARLQETKRAEAERIRLLSSLEKVALAQKQTLFDELFARLDAQLKEEKPVAVLLDGFGNLLSRFLFGANEECIMPPDTVEQLFDRLRKLDWKDGRYAQTVGLFLRAARVVDDRSLNLPRRSAGKIVSKLEKSGVPENRLLPLRDFVPITKVERASSFGESLPPGLLLEG